MKDWIISAKTGNTARMCLTVAIEHNVERSKQCSTAWKGSSGHIDQKRRNKTVSICRNMVACVDYPKESTLKTLLELISELSLVTEYKINTQKSLYFHPLAINTKNGS